MQKVMQTTSSGNVKTNPYATFKMANKGPVLVLSKSVPQVVMISVNEWNRLADKIAYLEGLVDALSRSAKTGEDVTQLIDITDRLDGMIDAALEIQSDVEITPNA
ncbi:type II toxin-antitoxin system Phd/YefM family antitoxin [Chloroflexi bacterium TSY]|nr:type II toxin-antitoxin system Phd/YefM family antitoxin [Chloroflexi bacterium TSY]